MSLRGRRHQEKLHLLQSSPLFADLHADELELLAELCQEAEFQPEEIVFQKGEPGDCVFVIEEGEAAVVRLDAAGSESCLAVLGRSEFFGEMSVFERSTRSATVRAVTPLRCLTLSTEDLYSFARIFMNGFTLVVINVARTLSQRLRVTTDQLVSR